MAALNHDYTAIYAQRLAVLRRLREEPDRLPALRMFYRDNPVHFIRDWGVTFDPRNVGTKIPAVLPFIPYPKQEEFLYWMLGCINDEKDGVGDKSRDVGMSWLAVSLAATQCLLNDGYVVGFGSRKEEYVDKLDSPKALFWKARYFIKMLPPEFKGSWNPDKHAPYMRIVFPDTGSVMTGEAGDSIGRGDRTKWYLVDESSHLEHPESIDASLSQTTRCRVDIGSANGTNNPFYRKVHGGKIRHFRIHWRDDPRKDQAWYEAECDRLDPVTLAQEVDINYSASVEGVLIPATWVNACVDAHKKLGISPTGVKRAALDVADEGVDLNAVAARHGILLSHIESRSGKGSDIFQTTAWAMGLAEQMDCEQLDFDADGLGAGVRGDAAEINGQRRKVGKREIKVTPFRGSGEVVDGEKDNIVKGRKNKDFFANAKAQAWWALRVRVQNTFRAVVQGLPYDPDEIISISSECPEHIKLLTELSQPTYTINTVGKVLVDKAPNGSRSPNLADAAMILYAPARKGTQSFFSM